jgi:hypothetical protein
MFYIPSIGLTEIDNSATVPVILAVVITVVILVLISIPIFIVLSKILRKRGTRPPLSEPSRCEYLFKFSIEDKKGTLYRALEAFTVSEVLK